MAPENPDLLTTYQKPKRKQMQAAQAQAFGVTRKPATIGAVPPPRMAPPPRQVDTY